MFSDSKVKVNQERRPGGIATVLINHEIVDRDTLWRKPALCRDSCTALVQLLLPASTLLVEVMTPRILNWVHPKRYRKEKAQNGGGIEHGTVTLEAGIKPGQVFAGG